MGPEFPPWIPRSIAAQGPEMRPRADTSQRCGFSALTRPGDAAEAARDELPGSAAARAPSATRRSAASATVRQTPSRKAAPGPPAASSAPTAPLCAPIPAGGSPPRAGPAAFLRQHVRPRPRPDCGGADTSGKAREGLYFRTVTRDQSPSTGLGPGDVRTRSSRPAAPPAAPERSTRGARSLRPTPLISSSSPACW